MRRHLLRAFALIGCLTAVLLAGMETLLNFQQEERSTGVRLQYSADSLALNLRLYLEGHRAAVRSLAADVASAGALEPRALRSRLDRFRRHNPDFLTLVAADPEGRVVAGSARRQREGPAQSPALLGFSRHPTRGGGENADPLVSDVFRDHGSGGHPVVAISAPVLDSAGRLAGWIEGRLDLTRLAALILPGALPKTRQVLILDQRRRLIAGAAQTRWSTLAQVTGWRWTAPWEAAGARRLWEADGEGVPRSFIAARAAVAPMGWTVVMRRPTASLARAVLANQSLSLVALLGALAVAFLLAHWTAQRATEPLAQLRGALRAFRLGEHHDCALEAPPDAPAEIAEMIFGFADLTDRLDASYDEVAAGLREQERLGRELHLLAAGLERQVAERTALLAASEKRYRDLVEESLGFMCYHNLEGRILFVNPAAEQALGYRLQELEGRSLADLLQPTQAPKFAAYLSALREAPEASGLMRIVTRSGEVRIWQYRNRLVAEEGRPAYVVGHAVDITERHRAAEATERLALYDTLTGLANRLLFQDRLRLALDEADRRNQCAAILFLDLDGFKEVNDRHGHAAGDLVLCETAARIVDRVRKVDTVARLGGDEFAVVLAHVGTPQKAGAVAEKVLVELAQGFHWEGTPLAVTASIGVSVYPRDGQTPEDLLSRADAAMYAAKRRGKNRWASASVHTV